MDWTGVTNAPTFAVASNTVNIYGSLTLATGMTVTNWTSANFLSTSTGNTITSGGKSVGTSTLVFNGVGGGWTLQDALICGGLTLTNGSFNTNDQTVTASFINSSNNNVRSLSIGSSIINLTCNACGEWELTSTNNLTFTSGTSTINMKGGNANFNGGGKTYNNLNGIVSNGYRISAGTFSTVNLTLGGSLTNCTVTNFICDGFPLDACTGNTVATATISKNATFTGDNTFGTLNLTGAGATYIFQSTKTQTIQTALNITGGTCSAMVSMSSSTAGSRATISQSSGTMALDYVNIKDMAASGGATFTVNNAINSGNNLGWTITTVATQNYYWVGGSGNWTDGSHWSLTSGGAPSGCGPNMLDNVYFDANSFTTSGRIVTLVGPTSFVSMDWTGVTNAPTFAVASNTVNIYGSLTLATGMTVTNWTSANFLSTSTGNTITSGGKSVGTSTLVFNGVGGGWTLQDALICGGLTLTNGSFNTNDQTVTASFINSSNNNVRSLSIGSSIINLTCNACGEWELTSTNNLTFTSGTSTINMKGGNANFNGGGKTYNNLNGIVSNGYRISAGTFSTVNLTLGGSLTNCTVTNFICDGFPLDACTGNTVATATISKNATFTGNNTFGDLTFYPGTTITFNSGTTQTLTGNLNANGSSVSNLITFQTNNSSVATIAKASGTVCLDYVTFRNIVATGGATFDAGISSHSQNLGGNVGIVFNGSCTLPDNPPYLWLGSTSRDWATATNWTPNIIPSVTNNALISSLRTNQPVISGATSAVVNNLTINPGASLTISGILTPSGIITNTGTLTVAPGGALVGSSSNVNGEVTVQASVVGQRGWRVFGNPFSSNLDIATVASTNAITIGTTVPASGVTDSRTYNIVTGLWSNVASPTTSWTNGSLYALFIRGLSSQVTGSTYTSNPLAFTYKVSGTLSNPLLGRNQNSGVFRVIGNPYAAPINTSALTAQTTDVPYYTYKISATGTPRVKSGSWVAASSNSSATTTIPVMGVLCYMPTSSAQFILSTSDINTTGTVQTGLFGSESPIQQLEINVNSGNDFADKLFIRKNLNATNNGKDRADLPKYENESTNFYTIAPDNTHLAVDARKEWNQNIPLGINSGNGKYSISVENNSLPVENVVYLKDKLLNKQIELKAGARYDFEITNDASTLGEKRFELFFAKPSTSVNIIDGAASGLQMQILGTAVDGSVLSIQVNGLKSNELGNVSLVDMNGRVITTKSVTNGVNKINISGLSKGLQLIKLSNGLDQLTKKFIKL